MHFTLLCVQCGFSIVLLTETGGVPLTKSTAANNGAPTTISSPSHMVRIRHISDFRRPNIHIFFFEGWPFPLVGNACLSVLSCQPHHLKFSGYSPEAYVLRWNIWHIVQVDSQRELNWTFDHQPGLSVCHTVWVWHGQVPPWINTCLILNTGSTQSCMKKN